MAERLWAPWRMEYLLADQREGGCVFCGHEPGGQDADEQRRRQNLVLATTPAAFVMLNRYPVAAGHLLVVPVRHEADWGSLSTAENDDLFRLARESVRRLGEVLHPDGLNVGMNLGAAAGAGVADHLHVHIVPRWRGDTNFLPVLADVRVIAEYLDATWLRLAPHFADLSRSAAATGT